MKKWILVKNRDGAIDRLTSTPVKGLTVADLTTPHSYRLWLRSDKVWVNHHLNKIRFEREGLPSCTRTIEIRSKF